MAKIRFLFKIMLIILGFTTTGCTTTSSINFASSEQPIGEYKHVLITINSNNRDSVLQRFYEMYPSDQYQVVAYEKVRDGYAPLLGALFGVTFGSAIGGIVGYITPGDNYNLLTISIGASVLGSIGYYLGVIYSNNYLITYIERNHLLDEELVEELLFDEAVASPLDD